MAAVLHTNINDKVLILHPGVLFYLQNIN